MRDSRGPQTPRTARPLPLAPFRQELRFRQAERSTKMRLWRLQGSPVQRSGPGQSCPCDGTDGEKGGLPRTCARRCAGPSRRRPRGVPPGGSSITANQPLINFCNKSATSLLTFQIAQRVYIISPRLWVPRPPPPRQPRREIAGVVRAATGQARRAVRSHGPASARLRPRRVLPNAGAESACKMLTRKAHFN